MGLGLWVWFGGIWVWWWDCGLWGRVVRVRGEKGALCGCFGVDFGALCGCGKFTPGKLSNL